MKLPGLLTCFLLIFFMTSCQTENLPVVRINLPWRSEPIFLPLSPLTPTQPAGALPGADAQPSPQTQPSTTPSGMRWAEQTPVIFSQLAQVSVSSEISLAPAPWQAQTNLPMRPIQPGEPVQLVASDPNGGWLLVLHQNTVGWVPAIMLSSGAGTLNASLIAIDKMEHCDGYLGSTLAIGESWQTPITGDISVQGYIFLPPGEELASGITLIVKETGEKISPTFTRTPIDNGGTVLFFIQRIGSLDVGATLEFSGGTSLNGLVPFQASFYTTDCARPAGSTSLPQNSSTAVAPILSTPARVITLQVIITSEAPSSLPRSSSGATKPWKACEYAPYLSRLQVGDWAYVSNTPPQYNRVRKMPYTDSPILGRIGPGEKIKIIKGPSCSSGYVWWKVRAEKDGLTGWTSEGDGNNYWLVPDK